MRHCLVSAVLVACLAAGCSFHISALDPASSEPNGGTMVPRGVSADFGVPPAPQDLAIPSLAADLSSDPDLAPSCDAGCGQPSCGACCAGSCGGVPTCDQSCETACGDCRFQCAAAGTCAASCAPATSCSLVAHDADQILLQCSHADCTLECSAAGSCTLTCDGASRCRLSCQNAGSCSLVGCHPLSCADGSQVCGRACP